MMKLLRFILEYQMNIYLISFLITCQNIVSVYKLYQLPTKYL